MNPTLFAQRPNAPWPVLAASLAASLSLAAFGQGFYNLDFERASLVPINGTYTDEVQIAPALPGWSVSTPEPYVVYDNIFLDSAGVAILDRGAFSTTFHPFQGNFTVVLEGGLSLSWPLQPLAVSIGQNGAIPPGANTMLFEGWLMAPGGADFIVSIAGESLPFYPLHLYTDYTLFGVDVSRFAGQTKELRFTANPHPPPSLAINIAYLDDIRFSDAPLAAAPVILREPQGLTVNSGSNVQLTVYATGFPAPTYQWFFDATNPIAGATNSVLELPSVMFSQSGVYSVVVSNQNGSATSSPASLVVLDPSIQSQPFDQTADAGTSVSFRVAAGGTAPFSYQWFKNGIALFDSKNVSGCQTATLTLNHVFGGDAGGYSVAVSNSWSVLTSTIATLTVRDPLIISQPASQCVNSGDTATFSVLAGGTEPFSYQWFNLDTPLVNGGNISGAQASTLTVANISGGEADAYLVLISNAYGNVTSQRAFVNMDVSQYSVLQNFGAVGNRAGAGLNTDLVLSGKTLYGTAQGTVFKLNTDGSGYTVLTDQIEAGNGGLLLSGDTLYGTTYCGVNEAKPDYGKLFKINTDGSGFAVLKSFDGRNDGGLVWAAPVVLGSTLYGTTYTDGSLGYGTVFKINTDGSGFTVIKNFDYTAGCPQGGLAVSGNTLYGTFTYDYVYAIVGGVFMINTDGSNYQIVNQFNGDNGRYPLSGLVLSGDSLYGTTYYGGRATAGIGSGTVFRAYTNCCSTLLKEFAGESDGAHPIGDLVVSGTMLYGTTSEGGVSNYGTIFRIATNGSSTTVIKRFRGYDGAYPSGGLVSSGTTLYGTTSRGGPDDKGVLFALSLSGSPSLLTRPQSQTAEIGSTVTFAFGAGFWQPLAYQWLFNGTNLLGAEATNSVLRLTNIEPDQAGGYSTIVGTNPCGSLKSPTAVLNVITPVERRWVTGFILTGAPGDVLNLETAEALTPMPNWSKFASLVLTNARQWYLDLPAPVLTQRFYRALQTGGSGAAPRLEIHMIPALTLTGSPGSTVRVDAIDQFGPTNAWFPVATVTLTNTSELYFDTSVIGHPPRLWRIVPLP